MKTMAYFNLPSTQFNNDSFVSSFVYWCFPIIQQMRTTNVFISDSSIYTFTQLVQQLLRLPLHYIFIYFYSSFASHNRNERPIVSITFIIALSLKFCTNINIEWYDGKFTFIKMAFPNMKHIISAVYYCTQKKTITYLRNENSMNTSRGNMIIFFFLKIESVEHIT